MAITVLDTLSGMTDVLHAPSEDRAALLSEMLAPVVGMYRYFPGQVDVVQMHLASFGFPLDRDTDTCVRSLDLLREADAWGRIGRALDAALTALVAAVPQLSAGAAVPDITVLLVLGDPGDDYFIERVKGVSGNGSATGFISLTIWPSAENLERLEATAVHELNHNLRYAPGGVIWDPFAVTVGEQVISEGLADAFARELYGDELGYTRIGVDHLGDDAVVEKVISGLDVTGMQNFVTWVHGDAAAERFGAEPVGLPTGAGYAAGNRLVDTYLERTGTTAASALHVPSSEIIDIALGNGQFALSS